MKFLLVILLAVPLSAESLRFTVNWASGLSLGEAILTSNFLKDAVSEKGGGRWNFDLSLDASIPAYVLRDHYQSVATGELCSQSLDKSIEHGSKKTDEHTTFDHNASVARRVTRNGGTTDIRIGSCGRDALTFLQFARKELAQGRLAPQTNVVFGAEYQVRFTYVGAEMIRAGGKMVDADHLVAAIKGPASNTTVDMYFARDAARTPVLAKLPTALGTFTIEPIP
jgi:hypothetical protein